MGFHLISNALEASDVKCHAIPKAAMVVTYFDREEGLLRACGWCLMGRPFDRSSHTHKLHLPCRRLKIYDRVHWLLWAAHVLCLPARRTGLIDRAHALGLYLRWMK